MRGSAPPSHPAPVCPLPASNETVTSNGVESLKHARQRQGMSLAQVAAGSGLLVQAVARAERKGIDPRVSTALAIVQALGLPPCEVFDKGAAHVRDIRRRRRRTAGAR